MWVSTWSRVCGIADYSQILFPEVKRVFEAQTGETLQMVSLDDFPTVSAVFSEIDRISPDFVHFQHEFGIFGGKNPPHYFFPRLIAMLRELRPEIRLIATAHNVLEPKYRYPVKGRGIQVPARALVNSFLLPFLRPLWGQRTWGNLDATVVHSRVQKPWIEDSGCRHVSVIPHFVSRVTESLKKETCVERKILVFGFFSPEKGQDIAIEAFAKIADPSLRLILAGGTRRSGDVKYLAHCRSRVRELGLEHRVEFTGYVAADRMDALYREADLVLAPFRETTGSGSLAHALARGALILSSDLSLNREITERQPDALSFFKSENADDCARVIQELLFEPGAKENTQKHRMAALAYAQQMSPEKIAEAHAKLYRELAVPTQTPVRWIQFSRYDLAQGLGGVEVHARSLQREALTLGVESEILRNLSDLQNALKTPENLGKRVVIHTHGSEPLRGEACAIVAQARREGVSIFRVHTFHGSTLGRMWACREFFWIGGYLAYLREIRGLLQADFLVGVNRLIHFRVFARILRKPFAVLPNAWDADGDQEKDLPAPVQVQLQKWKSEPFFVFVGRGEDPVKNAGFLKSLWPVEGTHLAAVPGAGFSESEAFHTGFLNPPQIRKLLVQSSGLLLASHYEGFPLVALEALAQGVPVFATHSGGADEIARFPVKGMHLLDPDSSLWRSRLSASVREKRDRASVAQWNQSVLPRWGSVMRTLLKCVDFSIASRRQP